MSEQKTTEGAVEDPGRVRSELERVAARSREAAQGEPMPAAALLARVATGVRRAGEEEARERARDERLEAESLAAGYRPARMTHETREEWMVRLGAWEASSVGREWLAARAKAEQDEADRLRRLGWPGVVDKSGVPIALAELVAAGEAQATDALVAIRSTTFRVLVLAGSIGVGKSVAAAWWLLAPHLLGSSTARETTGLWVSASRLARWERYSDTEMAKLLKAPRLVIDDLYAEFNDSKGNFLSILDEVINERLSNKRPLVITTNASVEVFRERYGERIADRIREHGRFVSFAGESMRRRST